MSIPVSAATAPNRLASPRAAMTGRPPAGQPPSGRRSPLLPGGRGPAPGYSAGSAGTPLPLVAPEVGLGEVLRRPADRQAVDRGRAHGLALDGVDDHPGGRLGLAGGAVVDGAEPGAVLDPGDGLVGPPAADELDLAEVVPLFERQGHTDDGLVVAGGD